MFPMQSPLHPKLTYLKIGVRFRFDAHQAFVDMVMSRWTGLRHGDVAPYSTERLRAAVLNIVDGTVEENIYEPLKRSDEEGMMVTVRVNDKRVV